MKRFALMGAAGFIAPRHLQAIHDCGGELVAATDPNDSVGVLDRLFPKTRFFPEVERFDRYLEKLKRTDKKVDYVSVCTPNYLHDAHCRLAMRLGSDAICEKPLVISPWNLDALVDIENETGSKVYNVLQLRLQPALIELKRQIEESTASGQRDIKLKYVTRRGPWYGQSWKGNREKSGGLCMNVGIHFFDIMMWIFGHAERSHVHLSEPTRMAGTLELQRARVQWHLSVDERDLPRASVEAGQHAFRSMTVDGEEVEFSGGFTDLHTRAYKDIVKGGGFGLEDSRAAIELVHRISNTTITPAYHDDHPVLQLVA